MQSLYLCNDYCSKYSGNMDIVTILLIAVGLAMDAFAVSIAKGIAINRDRRKAALTLGIFFGGFQMLMPAIGWLVGATFEAIITGFA
jgi:manganese efflux pump family protein